MLGFSLFCVGFPSRGEPELLFVAGCELLTAVAAPVAEHRLSSRGPRAQQPRLAGSRAQAQQSRRVGLVALWLTGSAAALAGSRAQAQQPRPASLVGMRNFPRPQCPLPWQADSYPLRHQGSLLMSLNSVCHLAVI